MYIYVYIRSAWGGEARQLDRLYVDLSQDNTTLVLYVLIAARCIVDQHTTTLEYSANKVAQFTSISVLYHTDI
jgi:hypothetical protein